MKSGAVAEREKVQYDASRGAVATPGTYAARKLSGLDKTMLTLLIIGGLNWGLVGLFNFDLVAAIFGTMSVLSRIIYTVVGISAVYMAVLFGKLARSR